MTFQNFCFRNRIQGFGNYSYSIHLKVFDPILVKDARLCELYRYKKDNKESRELKISEIRERRSVRSLIIET